MSSLHNSFGSLTFPSPSANPSSSSSAFPTGSFVPDHHLCLRIFAEDKNLDSYGSKDDNASANGAVSIPRLRSNLEVVWDSVLALHRRFRGDMTGHAPGVLKTVEATRAMTALHAANFDAFASRLLSLMSHTSRAPPHVPDRLRQLDSRMHANQIQTPTKIAAGGQAGSGSTSSESGDKESFGGVVLHRAPRQVRDTFGREHARHLFFLDFIIGADSARLSTALTPRLASAICDAVIRASRATSVASFTDAVLEARLHAKLLCTVLHLANWAHSSAALSGTNSDAATAVAAPLPKRVRVARSVAHGATCNAVINVGGLVDAAVASGEPTAITTTVVVAGDFVRFSALDPVARDTQWFRNAVIALTRARTISPMLKVIVETHIPADDLMRHESNSTAKIVTPNSSTHARILLDDQKQNHPVPQNISQLGKDIFTDLFSDSRLVRAITPFLDENDRSSIGKDTQIDGRQKRTSAMRRITPIAQDPVNSGDQQMKEADSDTEVGKQKGRGNIRDEMTGSGENKAKQNGFAISHADDEDEDDEEVGYENENTGIAAKLEREFFSRIDGRVRELVSVVAAAGNESALPARESFLKVMDVLYPKTPVTVAAVAAEVCAKRSRRSRTKSDIAREEHDERPKLQRVQPTPVQYTVEQINVPANEVSALERRMMFTSRLDQGTPSSLGAARQNNKMIDHDPN